MLEVNERLLDPLVEQASSLRGAALIEHTLEVGGPTVARTRLHIESLGSTHVQLHVLMDIIQ
jgi:hypothetical protein